MSARLGWHLVTAVFICGAGVTACGTKKPAADERCTDAAKAAKDYQNSPSDCSGTDSLVPAWPMRPT